jgi:ATP-dependent Clp protease adaptor protein ClpS
LPPTNAAETGPYRGAPTSRANTDVIFWNDKKTTMDFVIGLLRDAFAISDPLASRLMLTIDREGFAVVGTYERHEAYRLAEAAVRLAREQSFPLVVTVEEHGHIQSMSRVTRWLLRRKSARLATQFVLPEPRDS